jgi:hypothetical protein
MQLTRFQPDRVDYLVVNNTTERTVALLLYWRLTGDTLQKLSNLLYARGFFEDVRLFSLLQGWNSLKSASCLTTEWDEE